MAAVSDPEAVFTAGFNQKWFADRNRAGSSARMPVIHDTDHVIAADGFGNRTPEIAGPEPAPLVLGHGGAFNLVEKDGLPIERRPSVHHGVWHL